MKNILVIIISILFISCNSQEKQNRINKENPMNITVKFYPSSGGDAIYIISVINDNLIIKNSEPLEGQNEQLYTRKLNTKELNVLRDKVNSIQRRKDVETEIILDSWRSEVLIDDIVYFNESGLTLKSLPMDIQKLINFLIKDSKVKIDLYGFS